MAQRGRIDLRDVNGQYSTRYRFRLQIEREMSIFRVGIVPYINAEVSTTRASKP